MIFNAWAANRSPLNILLECKEKVLTLSNKRGIMCMSERERKSQTPERTNNDEEHSNNHFLHGGISGYLLAVRLECKSCSVDATVLGGACG